MIKALNSLPQDIKPKIYIFSDKESDFSELQRNLDYPFLTYWPYVTKSKLVRAINRFWRSVFQRNLFDNRPKNNSLDILFPSNFHSFFQRVAAEKKVHWIPDFQEHHLPDFFTSEEIEKRKKRQLAISEKASEIVFSSVDAMRDFNKLYHSSAVKRRTLHFAVSHDFGFRQLDYRELLQRYAIPEKYFICANQFWVHKNHGLVIDAIELIQKNGGRVNLIFTGKEYDYRNPKYPSLMKQRVSEKKLEHCVFFLGFIPRDHMLKLMEHSLAVIQPSLFEGWSTVIEDAKAMSKMIFASNLPVHEEQLYTYPNKAFFNPYSPADLKDRLLDFESSSNELLYYNYQTDVIKYANEIMELTKAK
jgi:glycosyltransferase involved in cell wall biosynthesis